MRWHIPHVRHGVGEEDEMHLAGEFDVVLLEVLQENFAEVEAVFDGSIRLRMHRAEALRRRLILERQEEQQAVF